MGLRSAWQGWQNVLGDRSMYALKDAFGQAEYHEDPEFQMQLQYVQQNPTRHNIEQFQQRYGEQMGYETPSGLAEGITGFAEGTPQYREDRMQQIGLEQAEAEHEIHPDLLDLNLKETQATTDMAESQARVIDQQLEHDLTRAELENARARLELDFEREVQPHRKAIIEHQIEQIEEELRQQRLRTAGMQIEQSLAEETFADRVAQAGLETDIMTHRAREAESSADVSALRAIMMGEEHEFMSEQPDEIRFGLVDPTAQPGAEIEGHAFNEDRLAGRTQDGRGIYDNIGMGLVVRDMETGQARSATPQERHEAGLLDPITYSPEGEALFINEHNRIIGSDGRVWEDPEGKTYYVYEDEYSGRMHLEPVQDGRNYLEEAGFFEDDDTDRTTPPINQEFQIAAEDVLKAGYNAGMNDREIEQFIQENKESVERTLPEGMTVDDLLNYYRVTRFGN